MILHFVIRFIIINTLDGLTVIDGLDYKRKTKTDRQTDRKTDIYIYIYIIYLFVCSGYALYSPHYSVICGKFAQTTMNQKLSKYSSCSKLYNVCSQSNKDVSLDGIITAKQKGWRRLMCCPQDVILSCSPPVLIRTTGSCAVMTQRFSFKQRCGVCLLKSFRQKLQSKKKLVLS